VIWTGTTVALGAAGVGAWAAGLPGAPATTAAIVRRAIRVSDIKAS
jgi:hypothetical protein